MELNLQYACGPWRTAGRTFRKEQRAEAKAEGRAVTCRGRRDAKL